MKEVRAEGVLYGGQLVRIKRRDLSHLQFLRRLGWRMYCEHCPVQSRQEFIPEYSDAAAALMNSSSSGVPSPCFSSK
jgi:hypothetical protein